MTRDEIIDSLWRSPIIDDMIWNITGGNALREELKSELFLILMEMSETKIKAAHTGKWLNYLCVNILTKQWKSSTSPFYKKFKSFKTNELASNIIVDEWEFDYETLDRVLVIVNRDLSFVEKELFMMRYKMGKYDKIFGELRDEDCKKTLYPYRKIEKRLALVNLEGGKPITIDHSTVEKYIKRALEKIKKRLNG